MRLGREMSMGVVEERVEVAATPGSGAGTPGSGTGDAGADRDPGTRQPVGPAEPVGSGEPLEPVPNRR